MKSVNRILTATASIALAGGAFAQGADDCANADVLTSGSTSVAFDTSNCSDTGTFATTGAVVSSCGTTEDVWFQWTATATTNYQIDTCGANYDTEVGVFTGGCNALSEVICNDDFCALQSGVVLSATAGTTYWIEVGFWSTAGGAWGQGTLTITELTPPPPPPTGCDPSAAGGAFAPNNGGNVGGQVYFDITVTNAFTVNALQACVGNGGLAPHGGGPIGMEVWLVNGSYIGNEFNQAAWTLVATDNGCAVGSTTLNIPATIGLAAPWNLTPGSYGISLIAIGASHAYANGTGANQTAVFPNWSFSGGAAQNFAWAAGPAFTPRVWQGSFCTGTANCGGGGNIGTPYCATNNNSTGGPGVLTASGSTSVAANDVTLTAAGLPNNQFGYFLNSTTQSFVPNPNNSQGNLCLGGAIGRYNQAGLVFNTGLTGQGSLALNLGNTPTPTGPTSIVSGQTWNFQCWYRDFNPAATSNFTNGLTIAFN